MTISLVALSCAFIGCADNQAKSRGQVVVTLPQGAAMMDVGTTVHLTATVQNDPRNAGVTWAAAGGGILSSVTSTSVTYTAPSSAGSATVIATAVADATKTATIKLNVVPLPTINPPGEIPPFVAGQPYSFQLQLSGGTPPYSWSVTQGQLPTGITLDSKTGLISGTMVPLTGTSVGSGSQSSNSMIVGTKIAHTSATLVNASSPAVPGPSDACYPNLGGTVYVQVTDSSPNPQNSVVSVVGKEQVPPLKVPGQGLLWPPPEGLVGAAYIAPLSTRDGFCPINWDVDSGVGGLAPGLSLDKTNERLAGIPSQPGIFHPQLIASDGVTTLRIPLSLRMARQIDVSTTSLPAASLNTPYSQFLVAVDSGIPGDGLNWVLASGSVALPQGVSLQPSGLITGMPTRDSTKTYPATYALTVCAFDPSDPAPPQSLSVSCDVADSGHIVTHNRSIKTLVLQVDGTPQPDFAVAVAESTLTVAAGGSVGSSVTVSDFNGFSGTVSLSASGLPTGVTASLSPTAQSGSGTSTLTLTAASSAPATTTPATVTISGTSGGATRSATVQVTVSASSSGAPALRGSYAFLIQGTDSSGAAPLVATGHFDADGAGGISNLVEDANGQEQLATGLTCSGTCSYTSSGDGQGDLTLTTGAGSGAVTRHYHFALNSSGDGRLVQTDFSADPSTSNKLTSSGVLRLQDSSGFVASAIQGSYAFELTGAHFVGGNINYERLESLGVLQADGISAIPSGTFDFYSGATTSASNGSLLGTFSAPDSVTGRGTMSLEFPSPVGTRSFSYYVIGGDDLLLMGLDDMDVSGTLAGRAHLTHGAPFDATNLNGTTLLSLSGESRDRFSSPGPSVALAFITLDSGGNVTGGVIDNAGQSGDLLLLNQSITGGRITVGPNGRTTGTFTFGNPAKTANVTAYIISPQFAFVRIQAGVSDSTGNPITEELSGMLEAAVPINSTNPPILGTYSVGTLGTSEESISGSAGLVTAASGNLSGSGVVVNTVPPSAGGTPPGVLNSFSITGTFSIGSNGRSDLSPNNSTLPLGTPSVFYVLNPNKFYMITAGTTTFGADNGLYVFEQK